MYIDYSFNCYTLFVYLLYFAYLLFIIRYPYFAYLFFFFLLLFVPRKILVAFLVSFCIPYLLVYVQAHTCIYSFFSFAVSDLQEKDIEEVYIYVLIHCMLFKYDIIGYVVIADAKILILKQITTPFSTKSYFSLRLVS